MESSHKYTNRLQRQLAHLKIVSRLLGHELHSQGGSQSLTLSRDSMIEIQTSIDLFIEEATRSVGSPTGTAAANETPLVPARN